MFTTFSGIGIALLLVAGVIGYYLLLSRLGLLKLKQAAATSSANETIHTDIIPRQLLTEQQSPKMTLPPAFEAGSAEIPEEELFDESVEFTEDPDTILLKEAEKVVDRIQDTVIHIASHPPNPEEVTSKIRAIVCPYQLFLETEYYDSINTFIALTLERDCGIILTAQQLQSLWN